MSFIITETESMRSVPKNIKSAGRDKIRFECVLQTAGDVNRNRRRYQKGVLEEGIQKVSERILEGSLLGELDHPHEVNNPVRQVTVQFKNASHVFREVGWDGNKLVGVLESLRTPNGEILKNLAEDGIPVGFSFRGMGDLKQVQESGNSFYEVNGPLHVITWDAVSYPSHAQARLTKINESVSSMLHEAACNVEEENGMICTEDGYCYLPNDFDRLVEQRVIDLTSKFRFHKKRMID